MDLKEAKQACVHVMWKNKLHRTKLEIRDIEQLGLCLKYDQFESKIILQKNFVLLNKEVYVKDVLIHEIAHLISGIRQNPHDEQWRSVYLGMGGLGDEFVNSQIILPYWSAICDSCGNTTRTYSAKSIGKLACLACSGPIHATKWIRTVPECDGKFFLSDARRID